MPITELGSVLSAAMAGLPVNAKKILHWATARSLCVWQQPELADVSKWHDLVSWKLLICSHTRVRGTHALPLQSTQEWEYFEEENICFVLKWPLWWTREKAGLHVNPSLAFASFKRAFRLGWIYQELCCPSSSSEQGHLWHQTTLLKSVQAALKASSHRAYTACLMISATVSLPSWTTNCSLYPVCLSCHLSAAGSRPARHWWEDMAPSSPSLPCQYRQLDTGSFPRLCPLATPQFLQIFIG